MALKRGEYIVVRVTQSDIDKGDRNSAESCAIANAIKRRAGIAGCSVRVGERQIQWWSSEHDWIATLPKRMVEWADDFDDGLPVKPTVVTLFPRTLS